MEFLENKNNFSTKTGLIFLSKGDTYSVRLKHLYANSHIFFKKVQMFSLPHKQHISKTFFYFKTKKILIKDTRWLMFSRLFLFRSVVG